MGLDDFLERIEESQKQIVLFLHDQFLNYPEISSKIRFKIPFYYYSSWVCYLNPVKPDKIELVFINGKELSNSQGLLVDRGRKKVAGIMLDNINSIPLEAIHEIFSEALILEEEIKKNKTMKK